MGSSEETAVAQRRCETTATSPEHAAIWEIADNNETFKGVAIMEAMNNPVIFEQQDGWGHEGKARLFSTAMVSTINNRKDGEAGKPQHRKICLSRQRNERHPRCDHVERET
jgi:hypothetical protein